MISFLLLRPPFTHWSRLAALAPEAPAIASATRKSTTARLPPPIVRARRCPSPCITRIAPPKRCPHSRAVRDTLQNIPVLAPNSPRRRLHPAFTPSFPPATLRPHPWTRASAP